MMRMSSLSALSLALREEDALPISAGYGGLYSHKLVLRRRVIDSFFSTARANGRAVSLRDYKKASVEEEKIVFPIQMSSTQYEWNIERELYFRVSELVAY